jgi:hypothetical protein
MNPLPAFGLWCLATAMSLLAAQTSPDATPAPAAPTVVSGPWILLGDDGAHRVGVELVGEIDPATVQLSVDGRPLPAAVAIRRAQVANRAITTVVELLLPASTATPAVMVLSVAGNRRPLSLPATGPGQASRVALAGADHWPSRQDLEALGTHLGGAVQVVVAYGRDSALRLGSGGWEADLPVILLPQPAQRAARDAETGEAIVRARLGTLLDDWPHGTRWGQLGLPAGGDATQVGGAIARSLEPWVVGLCPGSWWELGLLAPRITRDPSGTAPLIALCRQMQVPLLLTLGSGAGWISEPLMVTDHHLAIAAQGTRVVAATPSGDLMGLLPRWVAAVLDVPAITGLCAEAGSLQLVAVGPSGAETLRVRFRRDASGAIAEEPPTAAVDKGDRTAVREAWAANDAAGSAARTAARWWSVRDLTALHLDAEDLTMVLDLAAQEEDAIALLRRLTAVEDLAGTTLLERLGELPVPVARDLFLRRLEHPAGLDPARWSTFIARSADPAVLRAVMRLYQDGGDPLFLDLLIARVRAQAEGTTPLEDDVLLQHRLMTMVFDATSVSPTLLRPLAVALRPKLDGITAGPVVRFIARHAEIRP